MDVEPAPEELSEDEWIEVEDREWNDEKLLDDARPGRRKRQKPMDLVSENPGEWSNQSCSATKSRPQDKT